MSMPKGTLVIAFGENSIVFNQVVKARKFNTKQSKIDMPFMEEVYKHVRSFTVSCNESIYCHLKSKF